MKGAFIRIILCSILLSLGWPPNSFFLFLFFGFVPLLIQTKTNSIFNNWLIALTTLFIWNTSITYWLYYTLPIGAFLVHVLNALIFSTPFLLFYKIQLSNRVIAYLLFVFSWLVIEYVTLNWELAYPFLIIGNGLAKYPIFFQWYEYTGVLGGSLWLITANVFLTELLSISKKRWLFGIYTSWIFLPIALSLLIYKNYLEPSKTVSISSLQTNLDCYNEKYVRETDWVIEQHVSLSRSSSNDVDFILWPETAITNGGLKNDFNRNPSLLKIKSLLGNAKSTILSGAIFYKDHGLNYDKESEVFYYPPLNTYLTVHNSVIAFYGNSPIALLRTKEKLVPFEERIPYPRMFNWISNTIGKLGGFKFSIANDGIEMISKNGYKVTSLICYEILFGEFLAKMSQKGVNVFFLHLNEGWYQNEVGAKQFLYYTSLRSVETRRSIARSSNYGYSALINQKGEIEHSLNSIDVSGVVSGNLSINKKITFYAIYGDFIGRFALWGFLIFSVLLFVRAITSKK